MALRQSGDNWYGDGPEDVWSYFVWWTRDSVEPVKHWRQAVCGCGATEFEVMLDQDEGRACRYCLECQAGRLLLDENGATDFPAGYDPEPCTCLCGMDEFQVIGVTAPFQGDTDSAKWFHLGLRCVACGCLGCYSEGWLPRYNDYRTLLALL
jgi:hypothetical protein